MQSWKDGATRSQPWDIGRAVAMRAAPKGSLVAIGNHRNQVIVGIQDRAKLLVSSDNLKSFQTLTVPTALQHGESGFYLDAQRGHGGSGVSW